MSGKYTIKQVATLTGLSKEVIRKWEERYDVVQPKRMANGYRVFNDWDVHILKRVKHLVEEGYSAKNAAVLVKEESEKGQEVIVSSSTSDGKGYVDQLLEAGKRGDEGSIGRVLHQVLHIHGLVFLIENVIIPFLKGMGKCWEEGSWHEFQEHVASLAVRDFLIQIRRNDRAGDSAPLVLGACLPGEHHEIPTLIALISGMIHGFRTMFLGASPAPGAIEAAVKSFKPDVVLLSATTTIPFEQSGDYLHKLDQFASKHPNTAFYLGGQGVSLLDTPIEVDTIQLITNWQEIFESYV